MGLDDFSMSAISVPRIKQNILKLDLASAKELVARVMECATTEEVLKEIDLFQEKFLKKS